MPFHKAFLAAVKEALWHVAIRRRQSRCFILAHALSGYWYHLAMPGLVLDRSDGSVTLEVPSTKIRECLR
jgi:hypothetical protein